METFLNDFRNYSVDINLLI